MIFNYLKGVLGRYQAKQNRKMMSAILNDGRAIFSSFGEDVYMSDQVNNCIDRIATEISKIDIMQMTRMLLRPIKRMKVQRPPRSSKMRYWQPYRRRKKTKKKNKKKAMKCKRRSVLLRQI